MYKILKGGNTKEAVNPRKADNTIDTNKGAIRSRKS